MCATDPFPDPSALTHAGLKIAPLEVDPSDHQEVTSRAWGPATDRYTRATAEASSSRLVGCVDTGEVERVRPDGRCQKGKDAGAGGAINWVRITAHGPTNQSAGTVIEID